MRAGGRKSGSAKQSSLRLRASCATDCAEKTSNCADADENAAQACNDLLEVAEAARSVLLLPVVNAMSSSSSWNVYAVRAPGM